MPWTAATHAPGDEAYALIREALTTSGDIIPDGQTLHVRLDPLTAPRRTRALACLCDQLNATRTIFPGTKLTMRYSQRTPEHYMGFCAMSGALSLRYEHAADTHAQRRGP